MSKSTKSPSDDFAVSVGLTVLCQESLVALREVASNLDNANQRRILLQVVSSRMNVLRSLPASYIVQSCSFDFLPEFANQGRKKYREIAKQVNDHTMDEVLNDLYDCDRTVARTLRRSVQQTKEQQTTARLSSMVASFQISNDQLRRCLS